MPYGVGTNGNGVDHYELGMTIVEREPRIFYVNVGDKRVPLSANDLLNQHKYKEKCLEYGVTPPVTKKREDWENLINKNIETATVVKPSAIMRSNANEIELLTQWLSIHIPSFIRVGEKETDAVRVRIEEKRIYFKHQRLMDYCRRFSGHDAERMRMYIFNKCEHHEQGPGFRGWWRSTHSVSFDIIDDEKIEKWLSADQPVQEDNHDTKPN
jgi:hypothetical protein